MSKMEFSGVLEELNLSLINVEGWLQIQRTTFDINVEQGPFQSLQILANAALKRYYVRVWGRTVRSGELSSEQELKNLCTEYFKDTVSCTGYLGSPPEHTVGFVQVDYPCSRWTSSSCHVLFPGKSAVGLCSACSSAQLYSNEVGNDISEKSEVCEPKKDLDTLEESAPMEQECQKSETMLVSEEGLLDEDWEWPASSVEKDMKVIKVHMNTY